MVSITPGYPSTKCKQNSFNDVQSIYISIISIIMAYGGFGNGRYGGQYGTSGDDNQIPRTVRNTNSYQRNYASRQEMIDELDRLFTELTTTYAQDRDPHPECLEDLNTTAPTPLSSYCFASVPPTSFQPPAPRTSLPVNQAPVTRSRFNQAVPTPRPLFYTPHTPLPRSRTPAIARDRHSIEDLAALYHRAVIYGRSHCKGMPVCQYFYRDKTKRYFDEILFNKAGVMEVYSKDYHGDPKSPINGRIDGLFFSLNMNDTGMPPLWSIYGEYRLHVPPSRILEQCPNVYFSDFYCIHKSIHYVTLVLTKSGTAVDHFCQDNLLMIDLSNNPFIQVHRSALLGITLNVIDGVWIEALVTENINIFEEINHGAMFGDVQMRGKRTGGRHGLPKNRLCGHCNI